MQTNLVFWEDPLEKEMATHSSILAWRIPWTEEPDRLQSMGLQRVRHDWATNIYSLKPGVTCVRKGGLVSCRHMTKTQVLGSLVLPLSTASHWVLLYPTFSTHSHSLRFNSVPDCAKHFTSIITFHSLNRLARKLFNLCFTNTETEAQRNSFIWVCKQQSLDSNPDITDSKVCFFLSPVLNKSIDNPFLPKQKMQLSLNLGGHTHKSISFQSSQLPRANLSFFLLVHWVYHIFGSYCISQGPVQRQKDRNHSKFGNRQFKELATRSKVVCKATEREQRDHWML